MARPYPEARKFVIWIKDAFKLELHKRLAQDNLNQTEFMRSVLEAYVDEDPDIMKFIERKRLMKVSKKGKGLANKQAREEAKMVKDLNLNNDEIQDIFDLIEEESPDL